MDWASQPVAPPYKYKMKCLYGLKCGAQKALLRALSIIFWSPVKVFWERKSHFYGRRTAEDLFWNFYGPR